MGRLHGRTAVITGAAGGIGAATAHRFAAEGASLVLVDLHEGPLRALAAELDRGDERVRWGCADVSVEEDVAALVAEVVVPHGPVDVLFNNAGVGLLDRSLLDTSVEEWDHVVGVNLRGTFLMTKHVAPHVRDGGSIINQASVAARMAVPGTAAYSAAKGGVVALTRTAAAELGPGIRVNCICPGTVRTGMPEQLLRSRGGGNLAAGIAETARRYLLGRVGEPEELAAVALFLASDDSSFVTGAVMTADGGVTAQ